MTRLLQSLVIAAGLLFTGLVPSHAAVTITFYSHKFRMFDGAKSDYPHGFVTVTGTTDSGQPVNTAFGFSATTIYAIALLTPVDGAVDDPNGYTADYIAQATPHFAFPISDAQYQAVLAMVDKWRTAAQPSYDFYSRNCVTFVSDLAFAAGLAVTTSNKYIHDPQRLSERHCYPQPRLPGPIRQPISGNPKPGGDRELVPARRAARPTTLGQPVPAPEDLAGSLLSFGLPGRRRCRSLLGFPGQSQRLQPRGLGIGGGPFFSKLFLDQPVAQFRRRDASLPP